MIKAILVINDHGKPRLLKFYETKDVPLQQKRLQETFKLVSRRSDYMCNFVEGDGTSWEKGTKLIYRHYATLFFVFVVDSTESELGILDLIQTFVETLDVCFRNVCELDMIFNMDRVHFILDEIVQGGMVVETRKDEILKAINEQKSIESDDDPITSLLTSAKDEIGNKILGK
eukprot:TRINITY_DN7217_c0_g1_i1.p1 TRINITY_DN7217_c0_g1~~TRINITY_DN7217_c0_g1_i1.p1  ORF type:complete len:173 (+),score=37.42 TRINITY_DN7217_c0_g1_i1:104-622(+)